MSIAARVRRRLTGSGHPSDVSASERAPIVVISSSKDAAATGDAVHNGGLKLYNLWAKLLRSHGHAAFIATHDGKATPWLIDHQPTIPLSLARQWKDAGLPVRFVTGWLDATEFVETADQLYFYDCELAYTAGPHRKLLQRLRGRISGVATHSRTQQAWHMAESGQPVDLIPIWCDDAHWRPDEPARRRGRIGYMRESASSSAEAQRVLQECAAAGIAAEAIEISGDERAVRDAMQTCDVFLGLNHGKDPLWGEGSPIPQLEAMQCGCVVVAYDVLGNREYLVDGFNGALVPRGREDLLASTAADILGDDARRERMRAAALALAQASFVPAARWPAVCEFLQLEELRDEEPADEIPDKAGLEQLLGAPVYMAEEEIPLFVRFARECTGTAVELGAGYGTSTFLLVNYVPRDLAVHSIDPFVEDSMIAFRVRPREWRANVCRAADAVGGLARTGRWIPHLAASYDVAPIWTSRLGLLFIDGDHRYAAVRRDFADWIRFVDPGGIVLIHDSRREQGAPESEFARGWPGPTQLAQELAADHRCVRLEDEAFSLTAWRATGDACQACDR